MTNEAESKERSWSDPEWLTLPESGERVAVCRPTKGYFRELREQWPPGLVGKCDFQTLTGERAAFTAEERQFLRAERDRLFEQAFSQARQQVGASNSPQFVFLELADFLFLVKQLLGDSPGIPAGAWGESDASEARPRLQIVN